MRNVELDPPRTRPIVRAPIRPDALTLLVLQVACVLVGHAESLNDGPAAIL